MGISGLSSDVFADALEASDSSQEPSADADGTDAPTDFDPIATLARVQQSLERDLVRIPRENVSARRRAESLLMQVAKCAEGIRLKRPQVPTQNEVHEAVRGEMATAVEILLLPVRETEMKLKADRAAFAAWCSATLAPSHAAEVVGRVDAMLGSPAP